MGEWTTLTSMKDMIEIATGPADVTGAGMYFAGREGFGTYDYILHNLRIPTSANSRWLSVHEDETPVPGATYVQYTIHQCAWRGPLGLNAVGQHVTSTTTHVLYVREDLVDDFELVLGLFMEQVKALNPNAKFHNMEYTPFELKTVKDKEVESFS